jgi:hypothetical protein
MRDEQGRVHVLPLYQCWREPFAKVVRGIKRVARERDLSGAELLSVARLADAIERLPHVPDVALIEASLTENAAEGDRWLSIVVTTDHLEISSGESLYEAQGTESFLSTVLRADVGVGVDREGDDPVNVMIEIENWASEWEAMAADSQYDFEISDEDVYPENTDSLWEGLPDGV